MKQHKHNPFVKSQRHLKFFHVFLVFLSGNKEESNLSEFPHITTAKFLKPRFSRKYVEQETKYPGHPRTVCLSLSEM